MFGEPADAANAAWYAAEGNYLDAGLSLISVIPVIGDVIGKGGRLAKALGAKFGPKVADVLKTLNFEELLGPFKRHPKLAPHIEKIQQALEAWREKILDSFSDAQVPGGPQKCASKSAREDAAKEILAKAKGSEKKITGELQELAQSGNLKMEGLANNLKSEESLIRKLAEVEPGDIGDALRYTMVASADDLAGAAAKTLADLQSKGYEVVKITNTYKKGAAYKGLNTQLKAPNGQVFELQFHTPDSFHIKQNITHAMYEEARKLPLSSPRNQQLVEEMFRISDSIQEPAGLAEAMQRFRK